LRGKGRGEFEGCQLVGLVDGAQAIRWVHQKVGGIDHRALVAGQCAQRVGDEGRQVERRLAKPAIAGSERFPADGADLLAGRQAAGGKRVGQGGGAVAWLRRQREGLVENALIGSVADFGIAPAFIADEKFWPVAWNDDQQRLLETRVVTTEVGDIGGMLAVAIDGSAPRASRASMRAS
jgi:hypothetical protein